ncbi:GNAT family N-acetyltransferase [Nannocystis sp. bb15-2]|uniref:GNAT family N-acetyltransferase n=2 Tax=Nannocystis bainbridge TaxID=2995303 RepID=A0ABT5E3J4_9BACT|nr:GNAT family N-acetyltransferase [Nannocystis bainbridge]MDC0720439.1 GNAT family N-acetyltransferase [Nannocystis bainbridge]
MTIATDEILLRHAEHDDELRACYATMASLRPDLRDAEELRTRVRRQHAQGYRLLAAWRGGEPLGLAGYREQENLIYGRFVYVDDLVVREDARREQLGERLLTAVAAEARRLGCARLVLDTGMANALAQRFYFRQGLLAVGMHFGRSLD